MPDLKLVQDEELFLIKQSEIVKAFYKALISGAFTHSEKELKEYLKEASDAHKKEYGNIKFY